MAALFMFALGLLIAGVNTWQRMGRTRRARAWASAHDTWETQRGVLVMWPLVAIALIAGGFTVLLSGSVGATAVPVVVFLLSMVLWFGYLLLPLRVPTFVKPRWYRLQQPPGRDA